MVGCNQRQKVPFVFKYPLFRLKYLDMEKIRGRLHQLLCNVCDSHVKVFLEIFLEIFLDIFHEVFLEVFLEEWLSCQGFPGEFPGGFPESFPGRVIIMWRFSWRSGWLTIEPSWWGSAKSYWRWSTAFPFLILYSVCIIYTNCALFSHSARKFKVLLKVIHYVSLSWFT